jgi:prepilin-type N-terminal cleavage/methylation domain-containing protein
MKKNAFSLIELAVALFIVATLIAIAVPSYLKETNQSEVAAALTTLAGLERAAKTAYEENPTNSTITYGGVTFSSNVVTALSSPPVVNGLYIPPSGNSNVANNQFLVCVYVGKLNFSGYVAPTSGSSGTHSRVCKQVTANSSIYTNQCGALDGSSTDIPTAYLPATCNCAQIWGGSC